MKKKVCFLCAVLCAMMYAAPVKADVIWTPEDSFYQRHESECNYEERQYTANGPNGEVEVYESPESPKVVDTLENGAKTSVSVTYTDKEGVVWGSYLQGGWMPMEYMDVIYDSISFRQDHAAEITEEPGALDEDYLRETIYVWKYPASEECYGMEPGEFEFVPEYDSVYVDPDGLRWGNMPYFYGYRDVWICISEPTADVRELYPDGVPKQEPEAQGQKQGDKIVPKANHGREAFAIAAVAVVVLATAGLLVVLRRSSKRRP
ncbi:hypothetical protein AALC25_06620 [Lachnospiraceae bacterium 29-84]